MSTVEEMEQLIESAKQSGYRVRFDYFGGTGGGPCQIGNAKWMFIDLALTSVEQLELLKKALANDPVVPRSSAAA